MGLKDIFGGKKGYQCARDPNTGNMVCDVFSVEGDQKISSGTHLNLAVDPQSCEVMMADGSNTIVSGDEEEVKKITDNIKAGCRKGIA